MYSLFLDILGFAQLIYSLNKEENEDLERIFTDVISEGLYLSPVLADPNVGTSDGLLLKIFRDFQRHIISNGNMARKIAKLGGDQLSIFAYSDSAFIVTDNLDAVLSFSKEFMNDVYGSLIPVRGGLGYGSFTHLPLVNTTYSRSASFVQNPFLGSAIVNSVYAEAKGGKGHGPRIFVHDSAAQRIEGTVANAMIPLPDEEITDFAKNELNILIEREDVDVFSLLYLRSLKQMISAAPDRFKHQYESTIPALERMRDDNQS